MRVLSLILSLLFSVFSINYCYANLKAISGYMHLNVNGKPATATPWNEYFAGIEFYQPKYANDGTSEEIFPEKPCYTAVASELKMQGKYWVATGAGPGGNCDGNIAKIVLYGRSGTLYNLTITNNSAIKSPKYESVTPCNGTVNIDTSTKKATYGGGTGSCTPS